MGFAELLLVAVGLSMDAFAVSVCKGLGMKRVNWKHAFVIALFFGGFQGLMPLVGWALGTQFEQLITPIDHWIAFGLLAFIGAKMLWDAFRGDGDGEGDEGCGCEGRGAEAAKVDAATGDAAMGDAASPTVPTLVADGTETAASAATAAKAHATASAAAVVPVPAPSEVKLDMRELVMLAVATSIDALAVGITFAFLGVNIWFAVAFIGVTTFVLSFVGVALGNQFGARFERPATIAGGVVLILIGLKILLEHLGILTL